VIALADGQGLKVRLMGGLAFHAQCPEWTARINRSGRDLDLATRSKDRKAVATLLVANGYTADKQYNALYGHKQLYFVDIPHERPVDVLVDVLEMCHKFSFDHRLDVTETTLPPADLLLSKLQVVKINRKDVLDLLALLSEVPFADDDAGGHAISLRRVTEFTSNDWGWWRTATGNLDKLTAFLDHDIAPDELEFGRPARLDVRSQVAVLRAAIDAAPKSARWKLRSRAGDHMAWYQEPEEIGH
jgi:hypothetical protein